jgi:transposase
MEILSSELQNLSKMISERFDLISHKIDSLEKRIDLVRDRIDQLEDKMSTLMIMQRSDVFTTSTFKEERKEKNEEKNMAGKRWSKQEEEELLSELRQNMSTAVIAANHKRTQNAIKAEIEKLMFAQYSNGKSVEEIAQEFNVSRDIITKTVIVNTTTKQEKPETNRNNGKKWSLSDTSRLTEYLKLGRTIKDIASILERSETGVLIQIKLLITSLKLITPYEKLLTQFPSQEMRDIITDLQKLGTPKPHPVNDFDFIAHDDLPKPQQVDDDFDFTIH